MTIHSGKRPSPTRREGERGVVIVIFTIALIVVLLAAGLAVDLGIAHVTMGRLSKAVDAAALAGARHAALGVAEARSVAGKVAQANFGAKSSRGATYDVRIDTPAADTYTVHVSGDTQSPTLFARMLGREAIDVSTTAEATRSPLDVSLVLDVSYSLERNDAFDDMQSASQNFLENFDDDIDQFGIVKYSTIAEDVMPLRKQFTAVGQSLIGALDAILYTNIDEGLRLGKRVLDVAPARENVFRVLVLFTDGRPTAFGDALRLDGSNADCPVADDPVTFVSTDPDRDGLPDCWGGVITGAAAGNRWDGLYRPDNGARVIGFRNGVPRTGSGSSPTPRRLRGNRPVNGTNIRAIGMEQAEQWASRARAAGYTVYSIGLGDPNTTIPGDQPDLDFLRRVANEDGIVDSAQPKGELMFAPSPEELDAAFARLADRILTRLTR